MLWPSEAQPEGDLLGKKLKRFFFSLSLQHIIHLVPSLCLMYEEAGETVGLFDIEISFFA